MDVRDNILNAFKELVAEEAFDRIMKEHGIEFEESPGAPPVIPLIDDNGKRIYIDLTDEGVGNLES